LSLVIRSPVLIESLTSDIKPIRIGGRIGKYRLDRRMGAGGFGTVYAATDTLLGIKVALKIPLPGFMSPSLIEEFRREARLTMKLDHPNILPIRDASFIDGYLVIVSPLGNGRWTSGWESGSDLKPRTI
jgi:eukaryotic-like serine/threonine-protein kinase